MTWLLLILLTMCYNSLCDDQCFHKPCACCRTSNCNMNSTCENGCIDGYWGDSCFYTCPVNCINCEQNSPSVCDKCHDGYYNGFWHDGNSYGPWTDNCINKCNPQCKSCYYYQHCKECADGYYKTKSVENCTLPCPQRCISCISESDCTACKPGYFGINCSQICSKGCDTVECDKKTGSCNCTSNYMGETCRYCKHEKFGTNCDLECPENCLVCNQSDSCLYCKPGYEGPLCNQPNDQTTKRQSTHAPEYNKDNKTLTIAIGSMFGILAVVTIVFALLFWWRRRQRRLKKQQKIIKRIERNTFKASSSSNAPFEMSQEYQPGIMNISGNIDMEMSVYDEIPGWSNVSDVMVVPVDLKSMSSYENDSDYNEPKDTVPPNDTTSGYNVPIDSKDIDHEDGSDDDGSNYSFAVEKSEINENGKTADVTSNSGMETNVDANLEERSPDIMSGKDNPAYDLDENIDDDKVKREEKKTTNNATEDNKRRAKRKWKKKQKKGIQPLDDYEKLQKGKEDEHIYAVERAKRETEGDQDITVPETPGYEKPISFKTKIESKNDDIHTNDDVAHEDDDASHDNNDVTHENSISEVEKPTKDNNDSSDNNSDVPNEKSKGIKKALEDYEDLKKISNDEHDYEEGEIKFHDYTNFNNEQQRSSTFGVFSLA